MKKKLRNLKIAIISREHSKRVQTALFSLGYHWSSKSTRHNHLGDNYLFVYSNGSICTGKGGEYFKKHANNEVSYEALQLMLRDIYDYSLTNEKE